MAGTDTNVGPKQMACRHHRLLNASTRLALFGAIGGCFGIGLFHALEGRYQRCVTQRGWTLRSVFTKQFSALVAGGTRGAAAADAPVAQTATTVANPQRLRVVASPNKGKKFRQRRGPFERIAGF
jgi:hypothetical protein